ncbi:MAG: nickel-responsive transcriptional regulator NikR [Proteobacteria bacterium]|nr:nickel-responsive transcriptional regulator NikR [Cystobacterineae bacterium]MCL2259296.1 nickel-responsive transcriptional regulator NikR [Cystobacterineae bacterium]MCL2314267.1 nickel-responsive transcriptional regulator NikR [Pseudomonadota bacterium]
MLTRIGVSLENALLEQFDALIERRGYENRSEAIRDLLRKELVSDTWEGGDEGQERVASVLLVFEHDASNLTQKLTHIQHGHHAHVVCSLHVHLDERFCLEVLVLRGNAQQVLSLGESLIATKGVVWGKCLPAATGEELLRQEGPPHGHSHGHPHL